MPAVLRVLEDAWDAVSLPHVELAIENTHGSAPLSLYSSKLLPLWCQRRLLTIASHTSRSPCRRCCGCSRVHGGAVSDPHVQLAIEMFTRYTEDLWSAWSTWIAWYSLTTRWAKPAESYHILMNEMFSASE